MSSSPQLLKEKAYLYSLWSGKLIEYTGDIYYFSMRSNLDYWFHPYKVNKNINCSGEEGVMYNSVVWLSNSDVKHAAEILMKYQEQCIALLQERINNHLNKIEVLKGVISQ